MIVCVQVVFNPGRYRLFLGQLENAEKREKEATFQRTFFALPVLAPVDVVDVVLLLLISAFGDRKRHQNARACAGPPEVAVRPSAKQPQCQAAAGVARLLVAGG